VDVLVRPEHLDLEPWSDDGIDGPSAEVELVEYVGHGTSYLMEHEGTSLRAHRPSLPILQRGDRARIRYVGGPAVSFARGGAIDPGPDPELSAG
jgi:hypothetical protein